MFEVVERGAHIEKAEWEKRVAALRTKLLAAQYEILGMARFPVIVLINGVDGAGKSETVNLLTEWMDPRHIQAHAVGEPTDEELQRPPMYRFWRRLPPKGKTGIFFGNWYTAPIIGRALSELDRDAYQLALEEIQRFERMLVAEGALILKFWFHLSKKDQKKRLKELASSKKTAWRVTDEEWEHFAHYDEFRKVSEESLRATDLPEAPWSLVEGTDVRHASLTVGEVMLAALKERIAKEEAAIAAKKAIASATGGPRARTGAKTTSRAAAKSPSRKRAEPSVATDAPAVERRGDLVPIVRTLDLTQRLPKKDYEAEMERLQRDLALLTRHKKFHKRSPVLVFEGMDAAGKGGAIRRVTQALDARVYETIPIAAPTDEERAQPYLWRFWRHAPRDGKIAIFDRSWYGRVLVERVEGFCSEADWQRAYGEINDFEAQLTRAGNVVVKFWLQISPEEQLRRFRERERTAFKRFKITEEDWRNRDKWPLYELAASDMIHHTSTEWAPWTMVEAEDKYFARAKVLRTVVQAIEESF